jgi:37-kD nucleoid-associated bacterial protein
MIRYNNILLNSMAIHRVGNKSRVERNFVSESLFVLNEEMTAAFMKYFIKPLKKAESYYRFTMPEQGGLTLADHPLHAAAKSVFDKPENLLEASQNMLKHLYEQSTHPNIKSGEVFVAYFSDVLIEDELVDAIGIFKSEQKSSFFDVEEGRGRLVVKKMDGIHIEKLDKGCLIVNVEEEDGYRVISVDNNSYDASYWLHDFLKVSFVKDENFHTRSFLELCNNFSDQVIAQGSNKDQQIRFLNESVDYFNKHETFKADEFIEAVMPARDDFMEEFQSLRKDYELDKTDNFPISAAALRSTSRKFNNTIKLDTNIQIKLDYNNPEASRFYLEKGYDEDKGMHFYKVFFNEEV